MMKRWPPLVVALLLGSAAACLLPSAESIHADEPQTEATEERSMSVWMEKKLAYSQSILKGLSQGDFDSIESNARQMQSLSRVEGFVRRRNPEYGNHLSAFEYICREIIRQSEKKNIEGTTLAFNQLTINCVKCHQSLRESGE